MDDFKPLKTDFKKESTVNISNVEPRLINKINSFVNLVNENNDTGRKFDRRDYILNLIENDLQGLVLDNTFIELDKQYCFNKKELEENKKAIATTKPLLEIDDAIIINEVPNNCDKFNNELRTYCYNDNSSIHAGYYIFNDIHYYFLYDSSEEIIEVKIVDPVNMKYYVEDDELKEKLLNDNSFIMNSLKDGLTTEKLFETSSKPIMCKYVNDFEIKNIDYSKPIDINLIFNYFFEL